MRGFFVYCAVFVVLVYLGSSVFAGLVLLDGDSSDEGPIVLDDSSDEGGGIEVPPDVFDDEEDDDDDDGVDGEEDEEGDETVDDLDSISELALDLISTGFGLAAGRSLVFDSSDDVLFSNRTEVTGHGVQLDAPVLFMDFNKDEEFSRTSTSSGSFIQKTAESSNWVTLADESAFDFDYNEDFTVSFWMRCGDVGATNRFVIDKQGNSGDDYRGWGIYTQNGDLYFYVRGTNPADVIEYTGGQVCSSDSWKHYLVTYDGDSNPGCDDVVIYVDGTSSYGSCTDDLGAQSLLNNNPVHIGVRARDDGYKLNNHDVDEIAIWDRVLTSDEIDDLYSEPIN